MKRLVVVADASRARFFDNPDSKSLIEQEDLVAPAGRLHERDLTSDRAGRDRNSDGLSRHAVEPATSAKDQEAVRFAKTIADRLESARNEGAEEFVLVAPPRLLGRLRHSISKEVAKRVRLEINQDLSTAKAQEILKRLQRQTRT